MKRNKICAKFLETSKTVYRVCFTNAQFWGQRLKFAKSIYY